MFNLLYRASRDGFRATDFHFKCDNRPNTITIIETTKGYIFGGYTEACWTSNENYCHDPNAFLFSLVNPLNKPFLCKISVPQHAIYCQKEYGPLFGSGCDLEICSDSNSSSKSNSELLSYEVPSDMKNSNGIYFCDSKYFQVKEFEVFQVQ